MRSKASYNWLIELTSFQIVCLAAVIISSVFFIGALWEFLLEETILEYFGMEDTHETTSEHWRYVVTVTIFTGLALVAPMWFLHRANVKIRESEAIRLELFRGAGEIIIMLDREGRVLEANELAARSLGTTMGQLAGRTIFDVMEPTAAKRRRAFLEQMTTTREAMTTLDEHDGRWYETVAQPHLDERGEVAHISLFVRDVTRRQENQTALREREKQYRELVETIPHGIQESDLEGNITFANLALAKIQGFTTEELIGTRVEKLLAYEDRQVKFNQYLKYLVKEQPPPTAYFTKNRTKDGREIYVRIDWNYKRDERGDLEGFVYIITDITESKRLEEALKELNENLEERVKERGEQLSQEIAERMKAEEISRQHYDQLVHVARVNSLGELASGLAHEINQPLLAIRSYAEGCLHHLRSGKSDKKELMEVIGDIVLQAGRAGEIIQNIRELLRKDEGRREEVDMNAAIKDVIDLLGGELKNCGITLTLDLDEHLHEVKADRIQMEQVILNITRNGIEAMSGDGTAERAMNIRTFTDDLGNVEVSVADSGRDFPAFDPDAIFEPFFTTKKEGLGMGLSICRSIVESHGGRIWAAANPGGGATVSFILPAED